MDEIEWAPSILTAADREDIDRLADELMAELMVERGDLVISVATAPAPGR